MSEPITLEEAKNYLKVDTGDDNALITNLISVARELAETYTGLTFMSTSIQLVYDSAPSVIEIPYRPLQSVTTIETIDVDGVTSTVDTDSYTVDTSGTMFMPGRIYLNSGYVWPTHRGFASFLITILAGYGDEASDVPYSIRQAILVVIAHLYENRGGEGVVKARVQAIEEAKILLLPYKIMRI